MGLNKKIKGTPTYLRQPYTPVPKNLLIMNKICYFVRKLGWGFK
jgi:hypothetical protein